MGVNLETEHQDVLELCLHNDDHDLHSSAGNMDYSGDQSNDVMWGMRHKQGRGGFTRETGRKESTCKT